MSTLRYIAIDSSDSNGGYNGVDSPGSLALSTWMRLPQSAWGNYWACEEVALGIRNHCRTREIS